MNDENSTSFMARAIPPLPNELLICFINLALNDADSMEKKHSLYVNSEVIIKGAHGWALYTI